MTDASEFIFPPLAQERIVSISAQIESLQAQLQQFVDGVLVGAGVDVTGSDVSVDLGNMTAKVTPKGADSP